MTRRFSLGVDPGFVDYCMERDAEIDFDASLRAAGFFMPFYVRRLTRDDGKPTRLLAQAQGCAIGFGRWGIFFDENHAAKKETDVTQAWDAQIKWRDLRSSAPEYTALPYFMTFKRAARVAYQLQDAWKRATAEAQKAG